MSGLSEPSADDGKPLSAVRVILVDDDADTLDFIELALTMAGATVVSVDSAEAAVEALGRFSAQVLLSDLSMPYRDGFWLIEHIRSAEAALGDRRRLPVVAVTAHCAYGDRGHVLSAGFDEYLPKPIDFGRLISTVRRLASA